MDKTIEIKISELDKRLKEAYLRGYNTGFMRAKRILARHREAKKLISQLWKMFSPAKLEEETQQINS